MLNVPPMLRVVFFLWGPRVKWDVRLPGLARRARLLGDTLPAGLAGWKQAGADEPAVTGALARAAGKEPVRFEQFARDGAGSFQ